MLFRQHKSLVHIFSIFHQYIDIYAYELLISFTLVLILFPFHGFLMRQTNTKKKKVMLFNGYSHTAEKKKVMYDAYKAIGQFVYTSNNYCYTKHEIFFSFFFLFSQKNPLRSWIVQPFCLWCQSLDISFYRIYEINDELQLHSGSFQMFYIKNTASRQTKGYSFFKIKREKKFERYQKNQLINLDASLNYHDSLFNEPHTLTRAHTMDMKTTNLCGRSTLFTIIQRRLRVLLFQFRIWIWIWI